MQEELTSHGSGGTVYRINSLLALADNEAMLCRNYPSPKNLQRWFSIIKQIIVATYCIMKKEEKANMKTMEEDYKKLYSDLLTNPKKRKDKRNMYTILNECIATLEQMQLSINDALQRNKFFFRIERHLDGKDIIRGMRERREAKT